MLTARSSLQDSYKLAFGTYSGSAGDSLSGGYYPEVQWWASHQGMNFSTRDRDNDDTSATAPARTRLAGGLTGLTMSVSSTYLECINCSVQHFL